VDVGIVAFPTEYTLDPASLAREFRGGAAVA
jgi:hypothetical protein